MSLFAIAMMACADTAPTEPLAPELALARSGSPPTVEDCPADLDPLFQELCASVDSGTFADGTEKMPLVTFTNERDEFGLITKVVEADDKLTTGKVDDAIQKIQDFRGKVEALAGAPKLKIEGDVAGVLALADRVIAALQAMLVR